MDRVFFRGFSKPPPDAVKRGTSIVYSLHFFTVTTFVTTIENSELLHSLDLVRRCRVNVSHRERDGRMPHQFLESRQIDSGHRGP